MSYIVAEIKAMNCGRASSSSGVRFLSLKELVTDLVSPVLPQRSGVGVVTWRAVAPCVRPLSE